ncbi:TonB-dependent siderophore receptor [Dongia rigui]|uniref:TonB-dependent siderophore receptor n=1 Tax=Dongia rigui TaxID=940149 RepID=A0ABU5E462_9PROT|nr:TonB-dependent siderophore receptor [Dongia rigui]MDY0873708.1 TonB-dependent siderophore receptor [Dongia rigui]
MPRKNLRALLLSSCLLIGTVADMAWAQSTPPVLSQPHAIDIAPQALASALNQLAAQTGLQIVFDAAKISGINSAGANGMLTTEAALQAVLAGTGFNYRISGTNAVTLDLVSGDSTDLAPLSVTDTAETETAWGPVDGYVATQSATGTKTDTPLIETPQSISVVTRDEMEARNVTDMSQALAYTSGLISGGHGTSGAIGGDTVAIRGFGGDGTTGPSSNEYIDGLKLAGTGYVSSAFDPYFFERVEVLKGPASVLYGQSTPGGIFNMVSKRPTEDFQGEIGFQAGNNDLFQGIFDISGAMDEDKEFLYRLTATGWDNDTEVDFSDRRRYAVAPALTWRPNEDTSITLLARMQKDDFDSSPLNWLPTRGTVLGNPYGDISSSLYTGDTNYQEWDRDSYAIGYLAEHAFDDTFTVRQNFRYNYNRLDFKGVYLQNLRADQINASRYAFGMIEHSNDWTLDNQLEAKFDTGPVEHTFLLGVDGQILDNDTKRELGLWTDLDVFDPDNDNFANTVAPFRSQAQLSKQLGLYAQEQFKWDDLILTFGGRQDWTSGELTNRMTDETTKQTDDAFTWRAGVLYAFESGFSPYFSYSESFEPEIGTDEDGKPFKPTTGQQFEVGIKYQPPGYDSFITLSAFDIKRQNVVTADPVNPSLSTQTGEIGSRGIELEAKASLADGLDATFAYTYLDTEILKSGDTATGIDGDDHNVEGKQKAAIPTHAGSVWVNYTFQEGDFAGLGLGAGARYVGETYGDDANSYKVPDYLLFDAAVRYDFGELSPSLDGWIAQLNASNIADNKYVASCIGIDRCFYGAGRTIIGTVKYTW